ncbi:addiction module protein [Candidatus Sumerlaeota bacterium]|nr:addiction module protein [Candidatus Sumerlaeota bacterium]
MENRKILLSMALQMKPKDRFLLIDDLIQSLDEQDKKLKSIWLEEAEKRLHAHREGATKGVDLSPDFVLIWNLHFIRELVI